MEDGRMLVQMNLKESRRPRVVTWPIHVVAVMLWFNGLRSIQILARDVEAQS